MCFTATSDKSTAAANVRRWCLVSASFLSTNWRVHRRKFEAIQWTGLQRSHAHRTDAVLAGSHVCFGGTEAADFKAPQVIANRRATVSPTASCATSFAPIISHMANLSFAECTIDHDVLASHLESQFGVDGAASSWLRSYLRGRQQFVRLGRHSSVRATVAYRRVQCSVHCCSLPTCQLLAS